jgi:hypothetical protein
VRLLNASGCLDAITAPDVVRSLDAFVTKTVTPLPRDGNAPIRIAETDVGMLNSIGLANPGIERFVTWTLPQLAELDVPIWVSVGGFAAHDYAELCLRLDDHPEVAAIELNVSCPNVASPAEDVAQIVASSCGQSCRPPFPTSPSWRARQRRRVPTGSRSSTRSAVSRWTTAPSSPFWNRARAGSRARR